MSAGNDVSPLTKFQKRPLTSPLPAKAGGGRSERSKLREGVRPGFRTEETAAVLMPPSRMSLMAPFDLPQLRRER